MKYYFYNHIYRKQISLTVNLQLPLEGQSCEVIEKTDFNRAIPLCPSNISSQGICALLSGFREGSIPESFKFQLKIIREIACTVQIEPKIYLHSHLGLERTCLVVVCYKIFRENTSMELAYQSIKKQRNLISQ